MSSACQQRQRPVPCLLQCCFRVGAYWQSAAAHLLTRAPKFTIHQTVTWEATGSTHFERDSQAVLFVFLVCERIHSQ